MVIFTLYALAVGYFAARWRRTLRGVLAVMAGEGVLVFLAWWHLQIPLLASRGVTLFEGIDILPFQILLYPYMIFVVAMGVFVVCLPKKAPVDSCWHCRYDLSSLVEEPGLLICPECGREHVGLRARGYRVSGEERFNLSKGDVKEHARLVRTDMTKEPADLIVALEDCDRG